MENIPEQEEEEVGLTPEELKKAEENEIAKKISGILKDTISKMEPICKAITEVRLQPPYALTYDLPLTHGVSI